MVRAPSLRDVTRHLLAWSRRGTSVVSGCGKREVLTTSLDRRRETGAIRRQKMSRDAEQRFLTPFVALSLLLSLLHRVFLFRFDGTGCGIGGHCSGRRSTGAGNLGAAGAMSAGPDRRLPQTQRGSLFRQIISRPARMSAVTGAGTGHLVSPARSIACTWPRCRSKRIFLPFP